MTTPQDIQAAVDPSKEENWRYHDEYEFWYIEMPNTEIKTQRGDFTHGVGDRGFKPWELFQSHAPEASTVDVEALKEIKHDENHYKNLHPNCNPSHYSGWMHGWNDCVDELLSRGFRQGGGKGDVLIAALQDIKGMTDADDPESYRCDDREGCLDTVFEVASEALARCVPDDGGGND